MRGSYDGYEAPISLADVMLKVVLMLFVLYLAASLQAKKNAEEANVMKKAEFVATAEWDKARSDAVDCDVDMWVRDPDGQIVYFNHQEGAGMNIERDDLGDRNDKVTNIFGQEVSGADEDKEYWYLRTIKPGEYTINLNLFGCRIDGDMYSSDPGRVRVWDLPVEVVLTKLNPRMETVDVRTVVLPRVKDEVTAVNFTLTATGDVESVTQVPVRMIQSVNQTGGYPP